MATERATGGERLEDERIQRFLASKEVVILSTVQADGSPLAMPMWFLHRSDAIVMVSVAGLQKLRNLTRDPRVCVVAESGTRGADIRNLTVHGRAEILPDGAERRDLAARLLEKYHPHLQALWGGTVMPPDRVMFRIRPDRVRSRGLS